MSKSIFDEVVLIGFGDIYKKILHHLCEIDEKMGFKLIVVEHEKNPLSKIERICKEKDVDYYAINDRNDLKCFFEKIDTKALIISAGNKFLFPKTIVDKANLRIVNFHNALLPEYPGRNAPSWAIYEGKTITGATWHVVNADVDAGEILWQGKCDIGSDTKAYELAKSIMKEAYKGWEEIAIPLLTGKISGIKQTIDCNRRIYLSKDIPAGGIVQYTDSPSYIYKVLRAMDYGFKDVFPRCKIVLKKDGEETIYSIKHYAVISNDVASENDNGKTLFIRLDNERSIKLVLISQ